MNKKYKLLILAFSAISAYAGPVSVEDAQETAIRFLERSMPENRQAKAKSLHADALELAYTAISAEGLNSFYVFNKSEEEGFIIVSGDDRTTPILGYAESGSFDYANLPGNFKYWLERCRNTIACLAGNPAFSPNATATDIAPMQPDAVAPLLGNIAYDQNAPYNNLCPTVAPRERAATGCSATAMAQIMKFHEHPAHGTGERTYTSRSLGLTLHADFGNTSYDWENMLDTYTQNIFKPNYNAEQAEAIATLMYQCGVAMEMDYNTSSSATDYAMLNAFATYFGYDSSTLRLLQRDFYTSTEWREIIRAELAEGYPLIYNGQSMEGGHSFVCDGYDSDNLFHINWGWDGNSNGYFDVTVMDPYSQGVGAGSGGYSMEQYILTDVQKSTGDDPEPAEVIRLTMPLTTNVTTVQKGQNFTIGFGMRNYGLQEMMPRFGFALYQGDTQLSVLASNEFGTGLAWGFGHNELTLDVSIPTSTEDGDYRIYPVYRNRNMGDWHIYKGKVGCRDYLDLTVSGNDVTIHSGETGYSLVLDGDLEYTKLYAGSAAQFSLKLKNEGTEEYVGVLAIYAQSPSLGNGYFLREGIVVKPGEVLDLTKSTRIGCPAGTYTMRVLYDRDRTGVLYDLTNSQSVDVKNPTDVTLRLLDDVAPVNAEIERGDELEINVNIKSEGGVYYNRLLAFVFDEDKNNVFTFYRDVFLEEDEETNVVLSSVLNLEPGKYEVDIWGLKPTNNNEYLRPTGGSHICKFTVLGSGVDEVADAVSVYPNPAVDVVNVENAGGIDRITIYSLEGRLCMDVVAGGEKSTDISVAGLPSGTYILKVENQDGVFTDKLIKK